MPTLTAQEIATRREAVNFHRSNLRLEGVELPEQLRDIQDRYIAGDLDETTYQQACIQYIRVLAGQPDWTPPT